MVCEGFGVWPLGVLVTISIQLRISTCFFWVGVSVVAGMVSFGGLSSLQGGVCSCCSFSGWSSILFHCLRLVLLSVVIFVLPDGSRNPPYRLRCIAVFCVVNDLMVASSRIVLILLRSEGLRNLMVCRCVEVNHVVFATLNFVFGFWGAGARARTETPEVNFEPGALFFASSYSSYCFRPSGQGFFGEFLFCLQ